MQDTYILYQDNNYQLQRTGYEQVNFSSLIICEVFCGFFSYTKQTNSMDQ